MRFPTCMVRIRLFKSLARAASPPVSKTLIQVQKTLQEEKITAKSVALEEGAILARFDTTDTQLRAREALLNVLGDKYVVALNLAPATPRWLAALYAEPMKLGLDLRAACTS